VRVEATAPVGARVSEVSLATIGASEFAELRTLLARYGVLSFAGQEELGDAGFVAFLRRFGPLAFTEG
jgi:taurine dioxygenase